MICLLLLLLPLLLQESRAFHAQRNRLMTLTNTLAHHVEQHRKISSSSSSDTSAAAGDTLTAAAAVAGRSGSGGGGDAVAAVCASSIDCSLVGCLSKLREPGTGQLFSHKVGAVAIPGGWEKGGVVACGDVAHVLSCSATRWVL
jgi:hypothetical protein